MREYINVCMYVRVAVVRLCYHVSVLVGFLGNPICLLVHCCCVTVLCGCCRLGRPSNLYAMRCAGRGEKVSSSHDDGVRLNNVMNNSELAF